MASSLLSTSSLSEEDDSYAISFSFFKSNGKEFLFFKPNFYSTFISFEIIRSFDGSFKASTY